MLFLVPCEVHISGLCPSKSGLMNKHIVKHIGTNEQTYRENISTVQGLQAGRQAVVNAVVQ